MTLLLHAVSSSPNNHIYTHPAFYQLPSCSVPWSQLNKNKSPTAHQTPKDRTKIRISINQLSNSTNKNQFNQTRIPIQKRNSIISVQFYSVRED
uniref:Transcriptional corepressor LEUNIG_HOMOLOG isoform X2 n=1 Tax=Rhizophora mucronata TaxID=61149 RepID=A0A2P2J188_RHIMU